MKLHTNAVYFLLVLIVRGSASAMFKAGCVSLITKKRIKTKKAKRNFLFITIPSMVLYLVHLFLKTSYMEYLTNCLSKHSTGEVEQAVVHIFITFTVVSRCVRALTKILKNMRGDKRKFRDL